jgi:phospholipid transport system transporter-binding protein
VSPASSGALSLSLPVSVTMDDASVALRSIETALSGGGALEIDAAALAEVDTAAVALLLQAQRLAKARGVAVTLVNPPDKLLALARLYGVESLLGAGPAGSAKPA